MTKFSMTKLNTFVSNKKISKLNFFYKSYYYFYYRSYNYYDFFNYN